MTIAELIQSLQSFPQNLKVDEKTPRQRLKESLKENAEHIEKQWTEEMRSAISTVRIFDVAPASAETPTRSMRSTAHLPEEGSATSRDGNRRQRETEVPQ